MRNTTTTVVIAAGVVLAAVIVTRTPAQQEDGPGGICCLPTGVCDTATQTDCLAAGGSFLGQIGGCGGVICATYDVTPQPTVTGVTVLRLGSDNNRLYRAWSDGQIDVILHNDDNPCPGPSQVCLLLPGTCPTDINRDGDTGINDFLTLLGGWGACT